MPDISSAGEMKPCQSRPARRPCPRRVVTSPSSVPRPWPRIGEFGVKEVARFEVSGKLANSIEFSPDSRTLVTASDAGNLDLWAISGRKLARQFVGVSRKGHGANGGLVRFLTDNDLALTQLE